MELRPWRRGERGMADPVRGVARGQATGLEEGRPAAGGPERRARVATVGARLPVVIDPAEPDSVTLDLDALGC